MENTADVFLVLVNDEEQYCLWPAAVQVPQGWQAVGKPAHREACLALVEELWRDMRPRSLREAIAAAKA